MLSIRQQTDNWLVLARTPSQVAVEVLGFLGMVVGIAFLFVSHPSHGIFTFLIAAAILCASFAEDKVHRIAANREKRILRLGLIRRFQRTLHFDDLSHLEIIDHIDYMRRRDEHHYSVMRIVLKDGSYIDASKGKGHDMLKLMRTFAKFIDVPLRGSKGQGW